MQHVSRASLQSAAPRQHLSSHVGAHQETTLPGSPPSALAGRCPQMSSDVQKISVLRRAANIREVSLRRFESSSGRRFIKGNPPAGLYRSAGGRKCAVAPGTLCQYSVDLLHERARVQITTAPEYELGVPAFRQPLGDLGCLLREPSERKRSTVG